MSTVDDLVISLTIKEGGKLDKLRKQLKAIVGDKGEKKFEFGSKFKKELTEIKDIVKWLRPTVLPTQRMPEELRRVSGSILKDLEDNSDKIIAKLLRTPKLKSFYKEFGVETEDELKNSMKQTIEGLRETVGEIFTGKTLLPPHKREEVIHTLNRLVSEVLSKREIGLEFWRSIGKFTPEFLFQSRLENIFRELGIKFESQKEIFTVKPEALKLEGIQKVLGLGTNKYISMILKDIENKKGDVATLARELDFFSLSKFKKLFGLGSSSANDVSDYIRKTIESDNEEQIKKMYDKIKTAFTKEVPKEVLVSKEVKDKLDKIVKEEYNWTKKSTFLKGKIDLASKDLEDVKKLITDFPKTLSSKEYGLELKKIISKKDIDELFSRGYTEFFGKENVLVIAEQIANDVIDYAKFKGIPESNLVIIPSQRELEKKLNIEKGLINVKSPTFEKEMEKLGEQINVKKLEDGIEFLKGLAKSTDESNKDIKGMISEVIKGLTKSLQKSTESPGLEKSDEW